MSLATNSADTPTYIYGYMAFSRSVAYFTSRRLCNFADLAKLRVRVRKGRRA